MGEEKQAKTALTWVVLAIAWTVVIGVVTTVLPQSPLPWPLTILFLVVWYLSAGKKQIDFVKERFASSYERRSWLAPIGLTVLILMGLGALSLLEVPPEPSQPATQNNPQPVVAPDRAATPPATPIVSPPVTDEYQILGQTTEILVARYGKPQTETPIPTIPDGVTLIFDSRDYRLLITFLDGRAVQVMFGSENEISQAELEALLRVNSEGSKFTPQPSEVGLSWEREDHKVSAMYGEITKGYMFAITSKALRQKLDSTNDQPATPSLLSVEEWREKAKSVIGAQMAGLLGTSRVPIRNGEAFFAAVGKPPVEGQEGKYIVFSWKCRDGVIVMTANAQIWQAQKMLIVEDFSYTVQ